MKEALIANLWEESGINQILLPLYFMFLTYFACLMIVLATKARKRRQEAGLGNDFLAAIKDRKYFRIVLGMFFTMVLSIFAFVQIFAIIQMSTG